MCNGTAADADRKQKDLAAVETGIKMSESN
jgi:hypothetical protein